MVSDRASRCDDDDWPREGWTIVGPTDRAMDLHLALLADEATEALSRVRDIERVKCVMGQIAERRRLLPLV